MTLAILYMKIRSIKEIKNFAGKIVLLRVDFNVPLRKEGNKSRIVEDFRIISALPTIRHLARYKAKIVLITHLGDDPLKDKKNMELYSTRILAQRLSKLLSKKVGFAPDCIGPMAKKAVAGLGQGGILMLENLRFHEGEKENSKNFARLLSETVLNKDAGKKNDTALYVNDAFSVSHRGHASVGAIKDYLPAYAGLLLEDEIRNLYRTTVPKKPAVAVMGGAKISTKLKLIRKLLKNYDYILIGGAMANNFIKAQGYEVGRSLYSDEEVGLAKKLRSEKIILPIDVVVTDKPGGKGKAVYRPVNGIKNGEAVYDIGPSTVKLFSRYIAKAETIVWNGPLGRFEIPDFRHGTMALARKISARSCQKAFSAAGGGETIEALKLSGEIDHIGWVSTGGGAMLAYLGGEKMPGLKKIIS